MLDREKAFELAVRGMSPDLYRYAYWLTRDRHQAEDLVQETFQKAWRGWQHLADEKALKKWLMTIARHEFLRRFEKKALDTVDIDEDGLELPAGGHFGLDEALAVRQALARAPASLREPLLLQVLGGFSAEEVAELQQTTAGAVMTRLTRARQWLRAYLQGAAPAEKEINAEKKL